MIQIPAAREALGSWSEEQCRVLPWRQDPSAYGVWVSETMLQQTRVDTVVPYYERFMASFPDVGTLAGADETDVLSHWAGLGYYRRCRNLQAGARVVMERFGGEVPSTVEELREIPGVGPYTAGAIASIAHGQPEALVDGNVARVLSRLYAITEEVNRPAGQRILWSRAGDLLDPANPSRHNQGLMELGALVCTPSSPECGTCPLSGGCEAHAQGRVDEFPRKRRKKPPVPVLGVAALVRDKRGRVLMARRPEGGLLAGLWELPGGEVTDDEPPCALVARLEERLGLGAQVGDHLASVEHIFTHRRLSLQVYAVPSVSGSLQNLWYTESRWLDPEALDGVPLSSLTRKVLTALGYTHE
ncbi:MAG: A/G-specific adenine glycosylase [Myxococcota bacterium]|nr:A/G-specific adenine glycosylase [Myxococcota bacterium]